MAASISSSSRNMTSSLVESTLLITSSSVLRFLGVVDGAMMRIVTKPKVGDHVNRTGRPTRAVRLKTAWWLSLVRRIIAIMGIPAVRVRESSIALTIGQWKGVLNYKVQRTNKRKRIIQGIIRSGLA